MAERKPTALCVEGKGWEPCRGCGEQPELAPAPLGSVMARCFTEGCEMQGKGESGWQLGDEWQRSNKKKQMNDEQITIEAMKIADGRTLYSSRDIAADIVALCTRVRDEQREADAQKCDAEKERLELMHDPENGVNVWELVEVADECATAIRNDKGVTNG